MAPEGAVVLRYHFDAALRGLPEVRIEAHPVPGDPVGYLRLVDPPRELVLAFGSGERTNPTYEGDPADDDNNRFWVVWDRVPLGIEPTDPVALYLAGADYATGRRFRRTHTPLARRLLQRARVFPHDVWVYQ